MCFASLKSMTYAIKAKKLLSQNYINSEIIKLDPAMTKKGCSYGVEFDCVNLYLAEKLLKESNIKYSQIITRM